MLQLQLPKWEFTWECEGSLRHTRLHSGSMKYDSRASLLACTLANPCLGCQPKLKVVTYVQMQKSPQNPY